jgi:predicted phosphoribosyltransferase
MIFKDRIEAAELLLGKLKNYKGQHPLVLGIPRGAIPMAKIIADGLQGELGAVLVRKIPAPFNPELAIGSIGLSGHIQKLPIIKMYDIPETYVQSEARNQLALLKSRQAKWGIKEPKYKGRIVVIVDDGIATGATTMAAIDEVRVHQAKKIVLATPVSSSDTAERIRKQVDDFVVLDIPTYFMAVGDFYKNFTQVQDEEVIKILHESREQENTL